MRALPSGEVAISTARRRLSCTTGRSAAHSDTATRTKAKRKLDMASSRNPGAKTCRCETDQAPNGSLHVGGIAETARENLQVLAGAHRVGHRAAREIHPPEDLRGRQIRRRTLKSASKPVDHYTEMLLEDVRKQRFLL